MQDTSGECQLVSITANGERGLVCQMELEKDKDSLPLLRRFLSEMVGLCHTITSLVAFWNITSIV